LSARNNQPVDGNKRGVAYMIGDAARIAGVSPTTVRVWDREGLVGSHRSGSGYRYFDNDDIVRLRRIAHLRKVDKLNTEGIRRVLAAEDGEPPKRPKATDVAVGPRLRELRLQKGMTLGQAGKASGLSPSFLSSLERDQTGAAPATLYRLVRSYGSTLAKLVRREQAGLAQQTRPGDRRAFVTHGFRQEQLIDGKTIMDASVCSLEPHEGSGGSYSHEGEELVYVLEGTLRISLGTGEVYDVHAGESLFYPSILEHEWLNPGDGTTRLVWVVTPPTF
jgi:DNA-binding transcriptional MerR regulator